MGDGDETRPKNESDSINMHAQPRNTGRSFAVAGSACQKKLPKAKVKKRKGSVRTENPPSMESNSHGPSLPWKPRGIPRRTQKVSSGRDEIKDRRTASTAGSGSIGGSDTTGREAKLHTRTALPDAQQNTKQNAEGIQKLQDRKQRSSSSSRSSQNCRSSTSCSSRNANEREDDAEDDHESSESESNSTTEEEEDDEEEEEEEEETSEDESSSAESSTSESDSDEEVEDEDEDDDVVGNEGNEFTKEVDAMSKLSI